MKTLSAIMEAIADEKHRREQLAIKAGQSDSDQTWDSRPFVEHQQALRQLRVLEIVILRAIERKNKP